MEKTFNNEKVRDITIFLKKKKKKTKIGLIQTTNLSEKEKEKKRECYCEQIKEPSVKKNKRGEYLRNYYLAQKK